MGNFASWTEHNWFLLLQALGIMGSLLFTALAVRQDTKTRQVGDLLTLAEHYREIWTQVRNDPKLERIARSDVDLIQTPISRAEEEFLDLVVIHFNTSWLIAKQGSLLTLESLAKDAGSFFNLPIPRQVWEQTKRNREDEFVRFVEESLLGLRIQLL